MTPKTNRHPETQLTAASNVCRHGPLCRSCDSCDLERAEVQLDSAQLECASLEAENARLQHDNSALCALRDELEDAKGRLTAENARLRDELRAARDYDTEHVAPFQVWAQTYLNSARWAGHSRFDAIKTELLERDAENAQLRQTALEYEQATAPYRQWAHEHLDQTRWLGKPWLEAIKCELVERTAALALCRRALGHAVGAHRRGQIHECHCDQCLVVNAALANPTGQAALEKWEALEKENVRLVSVIRDYALPDIKGALREAVRLLRCMVSIAVSETHEQHAEFNSAYRFLARPDIAALLREGEK